jgi:hypothetical protein
MIRTGSAYASVLCRTNDELSSACDPGRAAASAQGDVNPGSEYADSELLASQCKSAIIE